MSGHRVTEGNFGKIVPKFRSRRGKEKGTLLINCVFLPQISDVPFFSPDLNEGLITGAEPWQAPKGPRRDTHQVEQDAFLATLRAGKVINNGHYMAKSTMMAIMSRMSAYTGRSLTWEQAINSQEDLSPSGYSWDSQPPALEVAVPGVSKFL